MFLQVIRLQTNHLALLNNFYKDVLELATVYLDQKIIGVTAGKSQLIFEQTNVIENPFYHFAFN
ncbi:MAG: hypothetical protein ABI834_07450, partial [Ginsengibacter sp.]